DVLIDYMPAARVGDAALCIGPTDTISAGSATVFINGKPAARLGDSCAHGGKIIVGSSTVIIGDSGGGSSAFQTNSLATKNNDSALENDFTVEDSTSLALDFVPVVSSIKSLGQLITGTDLVTGEQISRGMETIGIAAGIFPGGKGLLKGITKGAKILGKSDKVVNVSKAVKKTDKVIGGGAKNVPDKINMRNPDDLMGVEPASDELISAVGKKRDVVIAQPDSEELRMLDYFGAEASVGGVNNSHILLRENPSKAATLEEFLHGTQSKLGITDRLGTSGLGSAETHVKDFMIRHQKKLGLGNEDIQILQILRDKGL
ncbi:MAG: PAAR domain-containing protein, partial [Methylococcaceae bacterium]